MTYRPTVGDVVDATVPFPRAPGNRPCLVTEVKEYDGELIVVGVYETNRGAWSTMARRILPPFTLVRSHAR